MNEFIDMNLMDLRELEVVDILKDKIGNGLLTGMLSEAVYCVDVLMLRENRAFEHACWAPKYLVDEQIAIQIL